MNDPLCSISERQEGLVTRVQGLSAGMSNAEVDRRLRAEEWERLARDVYRVPGSAHTWRQSVLAAVLTAGNGAAASHRSAAALWKLPGFDAGPVDVTRLRGRSRVARLGTLHETRFLPPGHLTVVGGIPVTSPGRTLLDLCGILHPKRAERAVANALAMKLVTPARLQVLLAEAGKRGRPGSGLLRRLVDERDDGQPPPESELERMLMTVLGAAGLPAPDRQVLLGDETAPIGRVDFVYRRARLVLEADSRRHHSSWLDAEADRRRDAALLSSGWLVLRVTWDQLVHRPEEVTAAVRGVFERAACPTPATVSRRIRRKSSPEGLVASRGVGAWSAMVALEEQARALADGVDAALPRWVERSVERLLVAYSGSADPTAMAAASDAGKRARADVGARVRALLDADIDEQRTNPLSILRQAVRYPTEVLRQAGVPPVERDRFAEERFPDDDYDLTPASFADIDQPLFDIGLQWGAAKAWVHKQRHGHPSNGASP